MSFKLLLTPNKPNMNSYSTKIINNNYNKTKKTSLLGKFWHPYSNIFPYCRQYLIPLPSGLYCPQPSKGGRARLMLHPQEMRMKVGDILEWTVSLLCKYFSFPSKVNKIFKDDYVMSKTNHQKVFIETWSSVQPLIYSQMRIENLRRRYGSKYEAIDVFLTGFCVDI